MGERIKIKIETKRHVWDAGIMYGLALARETLEKANTLPGVGLCRALLDAQIGDRRAAFLLGNLKAVRRAGHEIENIKSIFTVNETEIEIEFYDLADLVAESDESFPSSESN